MNGKQIIAIAVTLLLALGVFIYYGAQITDMREDWLANRDATTVGGWFSPTAVLEQELDTERKIIAFGIIAVGAGVTAVLRTKKVKPEKSE